MTKQPTISRWKSEDAKQRFHALEQAIWDDHGYPHPESLDVRTWAGVTRVYRWHGQGEPIVLLHGMGGTGLTWGPYVEELSENDVYAVDAIGDVGRSEQTALIADADDLARWLDEALAGAGIKRAHLVGTSYGGYLAMNLAARAPKRAASITLIDAGGLSPFRLGRFMLWGLPNLLGSKAPRPIRRALARTRPLLEDPRLMKLALLGQMNHPFGMPQPIELSDDELRSITVPTTAVIAGRSAPFEPRLAAQQAALIPGAVNAASPRCRVGRRLGWRAPFTQRGGESNRCAVGPGRRSRQRGWEARQCLAVGDCATPRRRGFAYWT